MGIKNNSRATRVVNVKIDGKARQVSIAPGETFDGEPIKTKVFEAGLKAGTFEVEAKASAAAKKLD